MSSETSSTPRFWWLKRIVVAYLLVAVLLAVMTAIWMWRASVAFHRTQERLRADGGPATVEDIIAMTGTGSSQALLDATAFIAAAAPLEHAVPFEKTDPILRWDDTVDRRIPLADEDVAMTRRWLAWQMPAINAAADYLDGRPLCFVLAWRSPIGQVGLTHTNPLSKVATALIDVARLRHVDGDDAGAIRAIRQILECADQICLPPPGIVTTVSARYVAARACIVVEAIAATLTVAPTGSVSGAASMASRGEVMHLIAELSDDRKWRRELRESVKFEQLLFVDDVESGLGGDVSLAPLLAAWRISGDSAIDQWLPVTLRGLEASDRVEASGLPWPSLPKSQGYHQVIAGNLLLSSSAMEYYQRPVLREFAFATRARACATLLAMRLFELDYGHLPLRLDELVPEYLPTLPRDTMAAGSPPLIYVNDHGVVALYAATGVAAAPSAGRPATRPTTLPLAAVRTQPSDESLLVIYRGHEKVPRSLR